MSHILGHISCVLCNVSCVLCHHWKKLSWVFSSSTKNIKCFFSYIASSPIMMIFLINSNITILVQIYLLQKMRFFCLMLALYHSQRKVCLAYSNLLEQEQWIASNPCLQKGRVHLESGSRSVIINKWHQQCCVKGITDFSVPAYIWSNCRWMCCLHLGEIWC